MRPCGNEQCSVSTGVHGGLTFGSGYLDRYGFWAKPCDICARACEADNPELYPCWPMPDTAQRKEPSNDQAESACLACGHVEPHERVEYEDTHRRCRAVVLQHYECDKHERFNEVCANEEDNGCYTVDVGCGCSSEDKEIASLRARIAELEAQLAERECADCTCGHCGYAHDLFVTECAAVISTDTGESCPCERYQKRTAQEPK
jgi:hypothetical protein